MTQNASRTTQQTPLEPVWLAAYPRSGMTYLRHVLSQCLGVPTFTVYRESGGPDCGVIDPRNGSPNMWPEDMAAAGEACPVVFVKTHETHVHASTSHKAVHLVRDGRDALISHTYYALDFNPWLPPEPWDDRFRRLVEGRCPRMPRAEDIDTWCWSTHTDTWLDRLGTTLWLRFEELIAEPLSVAKRIADFCQLNTELNPAPRLRLFADLHMDNPRFFRRGMPGSWMQDLTEAQQELFWQHHGHAMQRLGYERDPREEIYR